MKLKSADVCAVAHVDTVRIVCRPAKTALIDSKVASKSGINRRAPRHESHGQRRAAVVRQLRLQDGTADTHLVMVHSIGEAAASADIADQVVAL